MQKIIIYILNKVIVDQVHTNPKPITKENRESVAHFVR